MAKVNTKKDVNFLAALELEQKAKKRGRKINPWPWVIALAILGGSGWFTADNMMKQDDLLQQKSELAVALADQDSLDAQEAAKSISRQAALLHAEADELDATLAALSSYPELSADQMRQIFEIAGERVKISDINFDRQAGSLLLTCKCDSATGVPIFVSQMRLSGIFSDVSYDGFKGGQETVVSTSKNGESDGTTKRSYSFSVRCSMAPIVEQGGGEV